MAKELKSLETLIMESNERSKKAGTAISEERLKELWPKNSVLIEPGNWMQRLESNKKLLKNRRAKKKN